MAIKTCYNHCKISQIGWSRGVSLGFPRKKLQLCIEKHGKKLQIAFPSRRFFLKFLSDYASLRYASLRNLIFLINFAPVLLTNIILQKR